MDIPETEQRQLLEEISREAEGLTGDQQKDVLNFIRSFKDQRQFPRVKKQVEIDVAIGDRVIQSDSRDMSASGVLVNTGVQTETGRDARVVFTLPGQKTPFKLTGKVVRIQDGGVAIWFNEMTPYAQQFLAQLLNG